MKPSRRFSSSAGDRLRRPRGPIFGPRRRTPFSRILLVLVALVLLVAAVLTWGSNLNIPILGSLAAQASATPTAEPTEAAALGEPEPAGEAAIEPVPTATPAAANLPEDYLPRTPVPSETPPDRAGTRPAPTETGVGTEPASTETGVGTRPTPTGPGVGTGTASAEIGVGAEPASTETGAGTGAGAGTRPAPTGAASGELLYLTRGNLAHWRLATREINVLAENVSSFVASANGKKIAFLLAEHAGENGRPVTDLMVLDVETGRITVLLEDISPPSRLFISPDGRWIVYPERADGGALYTISTSAAGEPARVGLCIQDAERPCDDLAWGPDGQSLLWSDSRGIWRSDAARPDPQRIHENLMTIQDPRGETSSVQVTFETPRWSPAGRYALLQVRPLASKVSWEGLLDTRTGRLVEIPGSYTQADRLETQVGWMGSGSLWITSPGEDSPARMEIWRVLPTRDNLLDLLGTYLLVDPEPPASAEAGLPEEASENLIPDWPEQVDERYFLLGLRSPGSPAPPGIYRLDMSYGELSRLNLVPVDAETVTWAPDGSGAVVTTAGDEVLFAPANGSSLLDLRRILGADACCFTWLR